MRSRGSSAAMGPVGFGARFEDDPAIDAGTCDVDVKEDRGFGPARVRISDTEKSGRSMSVMFRACRRSAMM
eukprot:16437039-Heterocapsa_arctica.AAC.1